MILDVAELAAHAHVAEGVLDRALERGRELGDGQLDEIKARFVAQFGHVCGPVLRRRAVTLSPFRGARVRPRREVSASHRGRSQLHLYHV